METYIVIAIIAIIITAALVYVIRAKKKGVKCIGCADAKSCSGNCSSSASCNHKFE